MISSYPVSCPEQDCSWTGSLIPSHLQGGVGAEIVTAHTAWFKCPRCKCDWEVRITDDEVKVLPRSSRPDAWRDNGGES